MAIIVTVEGKPARRYVVCVEDEHLFADVVGKPVPVAQGTPALGGATRPPSVKEVRQALEDHLGRFYFGCQYLRSGNRVDEMYRTLGTWEVIKVTKGTVHDYYGTR